jgi:hypothetical protein
VPISITATPIGTDASGAQPRSVTINLVPTGILVPPLPGTAPTADFVFSPGAPAANRRSTSTRRRRSRDWGARSSATTGTSGRPSRSRASW